MKEPMKNRKTLDEYLGLNYPMEVVEDREAGSFFAEHPDLDGCMADGKTVEEAVKNLKAMRDLWIRARYEDNLDIPEPLPDEPSGRLLLRMAPWLHARLLRLAQQQSTSLNQLITTALAEFIGRASYGDEIKQLQQTVERLETSIAQLKSFVLHQEATRAVASGLASNITSIAGTTAITFRSALGWTEIVGPLQQALPNYAFGRIRRFQIADSDFMGYQVSDFGEGQQVQKAVGE